MSLESTQQKSSADYMSRIRQISAEMLSDEDVLIRRQSSNLETSGLDREELLSQGYLGSDQFSSDEKIVPHSYSFTPEELALDEEF